MKIGIDTRGIRYNYMGDRIWLMWFWAPLPNRYYSEKLHCTFSSLKEYKKYMGSAVGLKHRNVIGISYKELITAWVEDNFKGEYVVVLTEIDLNKKPSVFWENIPYIKKMAFTNEVVILRCKDQAQMEQIIDSTEQSFAIAWGFKSGQLVHLNEY